MHGKRLFKRSWMVVFGVILCFVVGFMLLNNNSFATTSEDVVETNFFGNFEDDGSGCGVYTILNLVIDILSMGVAILGVIGVTVAGIQYVSAKDSEEKTRKAKRRIFEIIIGLVAYAILFAAVQWLLPGGLMNTSCRSVSDEEMAQIKENEKNQKVENTEKTEKNNNTTGSESSSSNNTYKNSKDYKKCLNNAAKVVKKAGICDNSSAAKRILKTAQLLAYPTGTSEKTYSYKDGKPKKEYKSARNEVLKGKALWNAKATAGASCLVFTSTVVRASGIASKYPPGNGQYTYTSSKFDRITCKNCKPYDKSKPGDIVLYYTNKWGGEEGHAFVRGDNAIYEAQIHKGTYPHTVSIKSNLGKKRINSVNKKKAEVVILRPKN